MTVRTPQFNLLGSETSAYLQQHAHNPVAWQPWSDAAFELARERDVPVFVSIGYSTCHWCHVMAHESFEDKTVAAYLNQHFVSIKVDREERPDVDAICMDVCQATTGHGGWPLTIMMDADRRPFFAGTYFPRHSAPHRMGFLDLLERIVEVWTTDRPRALASATSIVDALVKGAQADHRGDVPDDVFDKVADDHRRTYDSRYGGFGSAPKFPSPHHLLLLLRIASRTGDKALLDMVTSTLRAMRAGGIYDQVGFGFHRYSTDERWHIPHFEKMLYDQAMLMMAYTEGWQCTHDELMRTVVFELATYLKREMTSTVGAFYSAQDADSDGEEGTYYVFTADELESVSVDLKPTGPLGAQLGITAAGNFHEEATGTSTGANILYVDPASLDAVLAAPTWNTVREQLRALRATRVAPITDTKILPDWNGLMIVALARASRVFGSTMLLDMARAAIAAVEPRPQFLDDHAMLAWANSELYQTTGWQPYMDAALVLTETIEQKFVVDNVIHFTSSDVADVPVRPRLSYDGAYPSGNSAAAMAYAQLGVLLHREDLLERSRQCVVQYANQLGEYPSGYCQLLIAWDLVRNGALEATIGGERSPKDMMELQQVLHEVHAPWVLVGHDPLAPQQLMCCRMDACEAPLHTLEDVRTRIAQERGR